jgi:hypothetical protein
MAYVLVIVSLAVGIFFAATLGVDLLLTGNERWRAVLAGMRPASQLGGLRDGGEVPIFRRGAPLDVIAACTFAKFAAWALVSSAILQVVAWPGRWPAYFFCAVLPATILLDRAAASLIRRRPWQLAGAMTIFLIWVAVVLALWLQPTDASHFWAEQGSLLAPTFGRVLAGTVLSAGVLVEVLRRRYRDEK